MSNPFEVGDRVIIESGMSKKHLGMTGDISHIDGEFCEVDFDLVDDELFFHYLALKPEVIGREKTVIDVSVGADEDTIGADENEADVLSPKCYENDVDYLTKILPEDSAERKTFPVYSGAVKYFPDALACIAKRSYIGNQKHNPDKPLHWDRSKSDDELDAMMRHIIDEDWDCVAWRAMAFLQKYIEKGWRPKDF